MELVSTLSVVVPFQDVVFEHFVDPLGVEGHVDEHGGSSGERTAAPVDAHAHDDLPFLLLAHQRASVVLLHGINQSQTSVEITQPIQYGVAMHGD